MTPKLDSIATEFIKRIPTTFKTTFTAGGVMPDSYALPVSIIIDYINRAMMKLFNDLWQSVQGDIFKFSRLLPELIKYSGSIGTSNGLYTIDNPYLDLKAIIGAVKSDIDTSAGIYPFINIWDTTKLTVALSGLYPEYMVDSNNPALIQSGNQIFLFPDVFYSGVGYLSNSIKIQYIVLPADPTTGSALIQNGSYDSPFSSEWNSVIVDYAYEIFLEETAQTM